MAASTLTIAIERKNWDLVALCLLLAFVDVASTLPPETLEKLLELLETVDDHR